MHKPYVRAGLEEICRQLESERCIDHRKHPFAKANGNEIELLACCEKFKSKLEALSSAAIARLTAPRRTVDAERILIIDTEVEFVSMLQTYLERQGKVVDACCNLEDAAEYLLDHTPATILVDRAINTGDTAFDGLPEEVSIVVIGGSKKHSEIDLGRLVHQVKEFLRIK